MTSLFVRVLARRTLARLAIHNARGVLEEARSRGYELAQLWTHADNAHAQRLYERQGFRRTGREKGDDLGEWIVHYERTLCGGLLSIKLPSTRVN